MATVASGYPADLEARAVLKNGARVLVRPIRPDDEPRLTSLYDRLSPETAYQRFFTWWKKLPPAWAHTFANVDYRDRLALVAERTDTPGPSLLGVARFEPAGDGRTVEIALVVQDDWQGLGLGSTLLSALLKAAEARGFRSFVAYVLAGNRRMLHLLRAHGEIARQTTERGVVEVRFAPRSAS